MITYPMNALSKEIQALKSIIINFTSEIYRHAKKSSIEIYEDENEADTDFHFTCHSQHNK